MAGERLLLHICCAPDAAVPWPELIGEGYFTVGFMYGGNTHPADEYKRRAAASERLAAVTGGNIIIEEWNPEPWLAATREFTREPEGGKRCRVCFSLQLEAAARHALENNCAYLSTTLTISPHKDPALINEIGARAAEKYGLVWVEKIWRRNDGFKRSVNESKKLGLYRQNYCGCIYSERMTRDARR